MAVQSEPTDHIVSFTESTSKALERLYLAGGLALVFVFIGLLSMAGGFLLYQHPRSHILFILGAAIICVCMLVFAAGQVYGPMKAHRLLRDNTDLIDTVQLAAIRLTDTLSSLQSLMFKNSEQVTAVLDAAIPLLAKLPGTAAIAFTHTRNVNELIVTTTESSRTIIEEVRTALIHSDAAGLRKYIALLTDLNSRLRDTLSEASAQLALPSVQQFGDLLQNVALEYTAAVSSLCAEAEVYVVNAESILKFASALPMVGSKIKQVGGTRALTTAAVLRDALERAQGITSEMQIAVPAHDFVALKRCLSEVREVGSQVAKLRELSLSAASDNLA